MDLALQTGQRVSEMVRLVVGGYDVGRQALRVFRHKRRRVTRETIAISDLLTAHLSRYIVWKIEVGQGTNSDDHLFVGKRGPLARRELQQI